MNIRTIKVVHNGIEKIMVLRTRIKIGDGIAKVATPIARTLKFSCIDQSTQELKPESRCNKRKQWLNGQS